jgi:antagonist of KipI
MSLKILKAGMLDSIQDMGRYGFQHVGINPAGTMDRYAAAITNILVGNNITDAVIEMHFPAPIIYFNSATLIALSGADFGPTINGNSIPINQPVLVNKNCTLQFNLPTEKSRCYLSVYGGFKINKWLGSNSTNLKATAGGFHGRKLKKEDEIEFNINDRFSLPADIDFKILPWKANEDFGLKNENHFFVLTGGEWNWLDNASQEKFQKHPFYVSHNSDRMGYRLDSEPLQAIEKSELVSSGVSFGTIQLLPDGQLIILMADHQTTGGYPRLGNIISTQLPALAQMKTGDKIQFRLITHLEAENLILKQQQHLLQLQIACNLRLENYYP